jgi:hypothetical protein
VTQTTLRYEDVTPEQRASWAGCWWGPPDVERYGIRTADEAIADVLDARPPGPITADALVVVVAMRPEKLPFEFVNRLLHGVIESLDVEFGDPDGDAWGPTPAVTDAWAVFCRALVAEYPVWACAEVARIEVDPVAWSREHRPDWLEESGGGEP